MSAWDGFARLSRQSEGILVLFRSEDRSATATVRWPAVGTLRKGVAVALSGTGESRVYEVRGRR